MHYQDRKRTATMSHRERRILTPRESRKRKERQSPVPPSSAANPTTSSEAAEPVTRNRLLAGYMAHEFLTNGTLFGQNWDPARAEGWRPQLRPSQNAEAEPIASVKPRDQSYDEVASLLKGDGAHVPEIVNPTQLARWMGM